MSELKPVLSFSHELACSYLCGQGQEQNCLISPVSVFICLFMAKQGARGSTKDEINKAMSLPDDKSGYVKSVLNILKPSRKEKRFLTLFTANAIFNNKTFKIKQDVSKYLKEKFNTHCQEVPFGNPMAEEIINEWVKKTTKDKITELVRDTSGDTASILVNAVYMKANWCNRFKSRNTLAGDFFTGTETVRVQYMRQTSKFDYIDCKNLGFRMIFMGFGSKTYRSGWEMGILLPEKGKAPTSFSTSFGVRCSEEAQR